MVFEGTNKEALTVKATRKKGEEGNVDLTAIKPKRQAECNWHRNFEKFARVF